MQGPKLESRYVSKTHLRVELDVHEMPDSLEIVCRYMGPADGGGTPVKPPKKVEVITEIPPIPRPKG